MIFNFNFFLGEGDFAKRTVRSLLGHMARTGIDHEKVWKDIIRVINLSLLSLSPAVPSSNNCFELFGFGIFFFNFFYFLIFIS